MYHDHCVVYEIQVRMLKVVAMLKVLCSINNDKELECIIHLLLSSFMITPGND